MSHQSQTKHMCTLAQAPSFTTREHSWSLSGKTIHIEYERQTCSRYFTLAKGIPNTHFGRLNHTFYSLPKTHNKPGLILPLPDGPEMRSTGSKIDTAGEDSPQLLLLSSLVLSNDCSSQLDSCISGHWNFPLDTLNHSHTFSRGYKSSHSVILSPHQGVHTVH